ncbi:recombination regulator RecX [Neobacillus thermocopriae]|uniref:recombination regulator RecX n=1 Tax=Neobacillus thermocopriae TaxID=1215031 RepID=UPI002E20A980|nr:recombination regulator RecX [Neobacillus thermocopriae]MED3623758.1 recombination regulator RecX [Neobacillus thermocopriae]MED3713033.1 recombination regulator RecX [Neobacillus thermocopriae]
MGIITKITTQQKNKDRFNIYMDSGQGEEFAFSVDSDVLIKFHLKKGMEIDEFSLMEIQYQDDIRKAYNLAVHYLARRMRSEKEVRDYLNSKEVDEPVINEVLLKLSEQKYLNDREFAAAYVRTQVNTTDKGPEVIKLELKEKGISEALINQSLDEFTQEQQIEKVSKISEKFFKKNLKESFRIQKQKLEQMLLRKGYPYEVIHIVIDDMDRHKEEDEEMEAIRYQGEKALRKLSKYDGYEWKQRMKQTLYRKGFSMELIEKYLSEQEKS